MPMNVESFNLDHTAVEAPFVRVADRKVLPQGDVLTKYDVRFCQPNQEHLEMPVVHSLEHTIAEKIRNHADYVVDFSPMGCQTGFYLIVAGDHEMEQVHQLLADTLADVVSATEVPAANEVQCGWGANHSLEGAQAAARALLERRDQWGTIYAEGRDPEQQAAEGTLNEAEAREALQAGQPAEGDEAPGWAVNEAEAKDQQA